MARSLPYVLIVAAIGLGVSAYLYILFDQVAAEIFASGTWGTGGEHVVQGQSYLREMWGRLLLVILTGGATTIIIASRRGTGGAWR